MYLTQHEVENYRNLTRLSFGPAQGVNVISGQNGQGKTNLLESVFLMTGARSFRAAKDVSLIQSGCDFAVLRSDFNRDSRQQHIRITIQSTGRTARLNGSGDSAASSLAGTFCCVVFSPEHLVLVKSSPDQRRRFIDTALCQISPAYRHNLSSYVRLVSQRNALLRQAGAVPAALDLLDVYNRQYVELAAALTQTRRRFCVKLDQTAGACYSQLSAGREKLSLRYESTLFDESLTEDDQQREGVESLRKRLSEEIKLGYTLCGPHRDDLNMMISDRSARLYASQGQQRCIVLSLKMAEADLIEQTIGERPILLLDDVLSELDGDRQDFLVSSMSRGQSLITSCTPQLIAGRTDAPVFTLENGQWKA